MVASILPLSVKDAVVKKRGKVLLGPLNLELDDKGMTVVMGPNGSGKTTLLRAMHGLERLSQGSVFWNCQIDQARQKQAFVFQTPVLLNRTVMENVLYPLKLQKMLKKDAIETAETWLERVGLSDLSNLHANVLSGGEKQKLAIARALACQPEILFLDEPTTNLDGRSTREIEAILNDALAHNIRIVMATHHIGQAKRLSDNILFLYQSKLHEQSSANVFFNKPQTEEAKAFLNGEILE